MNNREFYRPGRIGEVLETVEKEEVATFAVVVSYAEGLEEVGFVLEE